MPRPPKSVALMTKHISKEEREARMSAELALTGGEENRRLLGVPPEYLNDEEAEVYLEIVEPLLVIETLNNSDRSLIAVMSQSKVMMDRAHIEIQKHGLMIDSPQGLKANPAIAIYKSYENIYRANGTQIGLSASARVKLVQAKEEQSSENELNDILGALRG